MQCLPDRLTKVLNPFSPLSIPHLTIPSFSGKRAHYIWVTPRRITRRSYINTTSKLLNPIPPCRHNSPSVPEDREEHLHSFRVLLVYRDYRVGALTLDYL